MILRTATGQRAFDAPQFLTARDIRFIRSTNAGYLPRNLGSGAEFGVPTLLQAIRLCAVNVAGLTPYVVDLSDPKNPVPATRGWQSKLFSYQDGPFNTFDFFSDVSSNVDGFGNSFVQKFKSQGKIVDLQIVDPNRVLCKVEDGVKVFKIMKEDGSEETLTSDDILHIRGYTPTGSVAGLSLVQLFSASIGNMIGSQEFIGGFWQRGSVVPYALVVPGDLSEPEAEEILSTWESTHSGTSNMHRPGLLSGGATAQTLGMNLADMQFVDGLRASVEEGARIANVPVELLMESSSRLPTEQTLLKLLTLYIRPRAERILSSINSDPDLFDGTRYALEFDYATLREADLNSQGSFLLKMRQSGLMSPNEARSKLGLGPSDSEGADELLPIPVGAPGASEQGQPSGSMPGDSSGAMPGDGPDPQAP